MARPLEGHNISTAQRQDICTPVLADFGHVSRGYIRRNDTGYRRTQFMISSRGQLGKQCFIIVLHSSLESTS